jgi:hypothetical protein
VADLPPPTSGFYSRRPALLQPEVDLSRDGKSLPSSPYLLGTINDFRIFPDSSVMTPMRILTPRPYVSAPMPPLRTLQSRPRAQQPGKSPFLPISSPFSISFFTFVSNFNKFSSGIFSALSFLFPDLVPLPTANQTIYFHRGDHHGI